MTYALGRVELLLARTNLQRVKARATEALASQKPTPDDVVELIPEEKAAA